MVTKTCEAANNTANVRKHAQLKGKQGFACFLVDSREGVIWRTWTRSPLFIGLTCKNRLAVLLAVLAAIFYTGYANTANLHPHGSNWSRTAEV